jgi:hypothetical protein
VRLGAGVAVPIGASLRRQAPRAGRSSPVLGLRSGWIRSGREWLREGGFRATGRPYRPQSMDRFGSRCVTVRFRAGRSGRWSGVVAGVQCSVVAGIRQRSSQRTWTVVILTKWLSFTRLETRTKESYIYASDRVANSFAD